MAFNQPKKKIPIILIGFLLVLLAAWVMTTHQRAVNKIRKDINLLFYDSLLKTSALNGKRPNIPVLAVDINEKSIQRVGRWPWSRRLMAKLVDNLRNSGAVIIGFDIIFSDPEANIADLMLKQARQSGIKNTATLTFLERSIPRYQHDKILAKSLASGDTTLGFIMHHEHDLDNIGMLPNPIKKLNPNTSGQLTIFNMSKYKSNLSAFQHAAKSAGFLTIFPDVDGLLRQVPLVLKHNHALYPSFALEVVRRYLLLDKISIETAQVGNKKTIEAIWLGKTRIPTDHRGQVYIPYQKIDRDLEVISALDVLNNTFDKKKFENAIVIVGSSAHSLNDLHATPIDSVYPGMFIHKHIMHGLFNGKLPHRPSWSHGAELTVTGLLGLACVLFFPFIGALGIIGLTATIIFGLLGGAVWLLHAHGLVLNVIMPSFLILFLAIANLVYGFVIEGRQRLKLKHMFGQYVPPEIAHIMNEHPERYDFDGHTKVMSVLFSDIRGFTTISESLSVTKLKSLLNHYFTPITEIIFNHNGTVDKYVGDMIMAFWGAPVDNPQHAKEALACALDMIKKTNALRREFRTLGLPEIQIGVGINTGEMNVGDMGSTYRRAYTVLGNSVNLAARLEGVSKYYGVDIVVGENTQAGQKDFVFLKLDRVRVKGKNDATDIYALLCKKEEASSRLLADNKRFESMIEQYLQRAFEKAYAIISQLLKENPTSTLYALYKERIEHFIENPPPEEWDGVYEWTKK